MEIVTSWMLEGMEKGWLKGMEEGRKEGEANVVLRLLPHRVGPLSAAMEKRIRRLSLEKLEVLGVALLDFTSKQDLSQWLAAHK